MVSIQNPSVTVSDVWNYADRSITDETSFFSRLGNTLLNFMLGDTYVNNTWGWFLSQGIIENIKYLLNNRVLKVHSWNTNSFIGKNRLGANIVDYISKSLSAPATTYSVLEPVTIFKSELESSNTEKRQWYYWINNVQGYDFNNVNYICYNSREPGSTSNGLSSFNLAKLRSNETDYICYSITSDNFALYINMSTNYCLATNGPSTSGTMKTLGTCDILRFVDPYRHLYDGLTFKVTNVLGDGFVNISAQFIYPTINNWNIELYDGTTLAQTITVPIGTTNFVTPSSFSWMGLTNKDNITVKFKSPDEFIYLDAIKGISLTEVITTTSTYGLMVSK